MSSPIEFPKLSRKQLKKILKPPVSLDKPLRVVFDTDFDNEVDDHFALAWLLVQSKFPSDALNQVNIEAVTIEPYSFRTRLESLIRAYVIYLIPPDDRTPEQQEELDPYEAQIENILALGTTPFKLAEDPHLNGTGDLGVEGSYLSVLKLFDLMEISPEGKVFKGSTEFMTGPYTPVESEAARKIVELALSASPEDPLYIVCLACPTNVASAMLLEPSIIENIVVVWDSGYPTNVRRLTNNSLNLDEDLYASQLLFSSGVPLVYIPGFYIAQQLNMSQPDVETWFRDSGAVGDALIDRYMNNPLFTFYGIDPNDLFGRNWVIWDIANVGWLLDPGALPSYLIRAPRLSDKKKWKTNKKGHLMREAYGCSVNSIFPVFAKQLRYAYGIE